MTPSHLFRFLLLFGLLWAVPALAADKTVWQAYHAASFDVSYPANFTVKPSLKSALSAQRYDSVFFVSPDGKVKFYATTNAADKAPDIALKPKAETLVSTKTEKKNATSDQGTEYELYRYTWQTIRAKDGSYTRALVIASDTRDGRKYDQAVIAIQYANEAAYKQYRNAYLRFKDSLKARIYYGGSISVVYPPGFTARPSLRSGDPREGAVVSVFLTAPDKQAELYVFSPWGAPYDATDLQLSEKTETLVSSTKKEEKSSVFNFEADCIVTRQTIRAKDGSYTRQVLDIKEKDDSMGGMNHVTFGFKYRDNKAYERYAEDYQIMQKSLMLYWWD